MTSLAAPSNSLQSSLIEALAGERCELALEQAFHQLTRGGNLKLVLAVVQGLVKAGTPGIALRLLQSSAGLLSADPHVAVLARRLATLPSGEVNEGELARRFAANTAALLSAGKLHSALVDHSFAISRYRVFQTVSGNVHVIRERNGGGAATAGGLDFVFPFVDQAVLVQSLQLPVDSASASYLLIGVPSIALFNRLRSLKTPGGYRPPIVIVEPVLEMLHLWLRIVATPETFCDDQVFLFAGEHAVADFKCAFEADAQRAFPSICMTNRRPGWEPPVLGRVFHEQVQAAQLQRQMKVKRRLEDGYPKRDAAHWRERFGNPQTAQPPLSIVGFTNRFSTVIQHVMKDLASAFERRGCKFEVVSQATECCAVVDVASALASKPRDMIVVLDHLRFEYDQVMPQHIPFVGWIQDDMDALCDAKAGRSIGELDLVIGHSPHVMSALYGYPTDRFLPSSNLTDACTYRNDPVSEQDRAALACDVSYVSHGSETPAQLVAGFAAAANPRFHALMHIALQLIEAKLGSAAALTTFELLEIMLRAERESGHPSLPAEVRRARLYPQIARLYDRIFRHQALAWTAQWARARNRSFRIYGRGWENHPSLSEFACGEIESGEPLRRLYQSSAISLQINGYASLHQRLLDGIASGGFMLSRWNPADFQRPVFAKVQSLMIEHGCRDLSECIQLRSRDVEMDAASREIERLTGTPIALQHVPARQRHIQVTREANPITDQTSDEGLFRILREMRLVPTRVAADIPGFADTVFSDAFEMHQKLDCFASCPDRRNKVAREMREDVMRHDTYDVLVERILQHFRDLNIAA